MISKGKDVKISDIVKKTLDAIEQSRNAIFDIAEGARNEVDLLREEIRAIQNEVIEIIAESDRLEISLKRSMQNLAKINKEYSIHSQEEMRNAYNQADKLRVSLAVCREREKNSIRKRNELELRLKRTAEMVDKAERTVLHIGAAIEYLSGDLASFGDQVESANNKRTLAMRIIQANEEERSRISREIHDGPAQAMSNVVLKAEIIEKLFDIDIEKTKSEIINLKAIVRNSLQDVRRIIYDLRPMSLDDLGLKPTLTKYMENFTIDFGIKAELQYRGREHSDIDKSLELTIFRTIQECLSNIRKHSKASQVQVAIEFSPKAIVFRVIDDGIGFDVKAVNNAGFKKDGGFGIFGMKERIDLLGGTVKFDSFAGKGTTVSVSLPIDVI